MPADTAARRLSDVVSSECTSQWFWLVRRAYKLMFACFLGTDAESLPTEVQAEDFSECI